MERCLYCDQIPRSEEHPLPAALGEFRNGPTLSHRICKQCNEKRIGILDEQFVRCGPVAALRKKYGVQGRKAHEKINPFYRGSAGGKRIKAYAWDESFQADVLIELTGGDGARQLTQLILYTGDGKIHFLPLTPSLTPQQLREQLRALTLVEPVDLRLVWDPATEPWAPDLIKSLWPEHPLPQPTGGSQLFRGAVFQFEMTSRYFRAVAKMGFHYFLTQFPEYTGHEHMFDELRDFIVDDADEFKPQRINAYLDVHEEPMLSSNPGIVGHVLCAEIDEGHCVAHVSPFITPSGNMQAWRVRLGIDDSDRMSVSRSHLYLYFPAGAEGRYSGDALASVEQSNPASFLNRRPLSPAVSPAT